MADPANAVAMSKVKSMTEDISILRTLRCFPQRPSVQLTKFPFPGTFSDIPERLLTAELPVKPVPYPGILLEVSVCHDATEIDKSKLVFYR